MRMTFLPSTYSGKWSAIMMIVSWVLFVAGSVLPGKTDYSGFEIVLQNPIQAIITILLLAVGVVILSTGLISIIKKQERSILVFLAILSGVQSVLGFCGAVANVFFG